MFADIHCFFQSSISDLLSDHEDTGLLNGEFENLDDKIWFDIFEFFEIFGKLDMWKLEEFDGDGDIGLLMIALPNAIVVAVVWRFFFSIVVFFKRFLVLLLFHDL